MYFSLCYVVITHIMFLLFVLCLSSRFYVLLSILCVLYFCTVVCIVSAHVHSCIFCICVQVFVPLPPSGNLISVNKYHFIYSTRSLHLLPEM
jgi:hypothetical protein